MFVPTRRHHVAISEYVGKRANEVTAISNFRETARRDGPTAEMIKPRISQRGGVGGAEAATLLFIFVSGGGLADSKQL